LKVSILICIFHSMRINLRAMILRGSTGRICNLENVKSYMSYLQKYTKIIKNLTFKTYFNLFNIGINTVFLGNYLCINSGTNWIKSEGLDVKFVSEHPKKTVFIPILNKCDTHMQGLYFVYFYNTYCNIFPMFYIYIFL
jgi:hypothetical protein